MNQTLGFFTVATGDEHYYRIAENLLHSYLHFTSDPKPFAILCDRENTYTRSFDKVILLESPTNSYLDKLSLYDYLPWDVSIFIDADCLAYGDLNELLSVFEHADDFCCVGRVLPLDDKTGWFNYEDLGDLQSKVSYCVGLHGGIYFIRRTGTARAVFDTAKQIAQDYSRYRFKGKFSTPGDEPILALSMALNSCKPIFHDTRTICCYWEHENAMKLSLPSGLAWICRDRKNTLLVHWGTRFTKGLLYRKQTADLQLLRSGASRAAIALSEWKYNLLIFLDTLVRFSGRVIRKLKRILHLS